MRTWTAALLVAASFSSSAADESQNLMSIADVTCPSYLALQSGPEKAAIESWVMGRVVAIVPSTFQSELRNISVPAFRQDLNELCASSIPETTLFEASALIAYGYQQERPR